MSSGSRISSDLLNLGSLNRRRVLYARRMEIYIVPFFPRLAASIVTRFSSEGRRSHGTNANMYLFFFLSFIIMCLTLLTLPRIRSISSIFFFSFFGSRDIERQREMLNSSLVERILDNNEGGMEGERKSFARDSSARARRKGGGGGWTVDRKAVVKS